MDPSKAAFAAVAVFLGLLRLAQSEHVGTPAITLTPRPQVAEAGDAVAIRCDPVPIDGAKDRRLDTTPTQRSEPDEQQRHP